MSLGRLRDRDHGLAVVAEPAAGPAAAVLAHGAHGVAVAHEGVVHRLDDDAAALGEARRLPPAAVGLDREAADFVERDPVLHAVPERADDRVRVPREGVRHDARAPAALGLERLRKVPVEHRHPRGDPMLEHRVDQALVEGEALLVQRAMALGEDAGPCEGESVVADPQVAHEREILAVAVVVVARDIEGVAVVDRPLPAGVAVPHGLALSPLECGALDLGRGGGHSPGEFPGKGEGGFLKGHVRAGCGTQLEGRG